MSQVLPRRARPWPGLLAGLSAALLVLVGSIPAHADPLVVFHEATAEFDVTLTSDGGDQILTATVVNLTSQVQHIGLGVDLNEEGVTEYLWEQTWQVFRDQGQAVINPGETYSQTLLPAWSGMTYTFFSSIDTDPTEFAEYDVPGYYLPFVQESDGDGELTALQIGFPIETFPTVARAGEQLRVRAELGSGGPQGTAQVWYGSAATDDSNAALNTTLLRGISFDGSSVDVTSGFQALGTIGVVDGVADGSVTLPPGLAPGDYVLLVGDPGSNVWPAGPALLLPDGVLQPDFSIEPGDPRGTTDSTHLQVTPIDQNGQTPVSLTFSSVSGAGVTSVTTSPSGPPPTLFTQLTGSDAVYYDISTTATLDSPVRVCISYDPTDLTPEQQDATALYHFGGTDWQDVTTDHPTPGIVCGETNGFSPFAIGFPLAQFSATAIPTVSGTKAVGGTLILNRHSWDPVLVNADFGYQWNRDGVAIPGANATAYTLTQADAGTRITATVTAAKVGYVTRSETSTQTAVISGGVWSAIGTPTISGTPAVGQYLYVDAGAWVPAATSLRYQWTRADGSTTSSSTNRYTVRAADAGTTVSVVVIASKPGFPTVTSSSASALIEKQLTTSTPTITGSPLAVGSTLTAQAGWTPGTVGYSYQWNRDGVAIDGAIAQTHTLVDADAGTAITVTVTGSESGYTTVAKTSGKKTIQSLLDVPSVPTIAGTPAVGQVLSATAGTWGPGAVTLKYQWVRAGVVVGTAAQYTVKTADAGQAITVTVTGSRSGYTSRSSTSAPTPIESLFAPGTPVVSGTLAVGSPLTVTPGTWSPVPQTFTYTWMRGVTVLGTGSSYTPTPADAGQLVSVTVTGSSTGYTSAARTVSKSIPSIFTAVPTPTISGTPTVGQTLTAVPGPWTPTPTTYSYSWVRDGVTVVGTASTYKPKSADRGHVVTVIVSGTKTGYTKATSAASAEVTIN